MSEYRGKTVTFRDTAGEIIGSYDPENRKSYSSVHADIMSAMREDRITEGRGLAYIQTLKNAAGIKDTSTKVMGDHDLEKRIKRLLASEKLLSRIERDSQGYSEEAA